MAHIDLSVKHGLTPDVARAIFEKKLDDASTRYPKWIQRLDWAPDRASVTVFGPGIEVRVWHDSEEVHAKGKVPIFVKLFEGPLKAIVRQTLGVDTPR